MAAGFAVYETSALRTTLRTLQSQDMAFPALPDTRLNAVDLESTFPGLDADDLNAVDVLFSMLRAKSMESRFTDIPSDISYPSSTEAEARILPNIVQEERRREYRQRATMRATPLFSHSYSPKSDRADLRPELWRKAPKQYQEEYHHQVVTYIKGLTDHEIHCIYHGIDIIKDKPEYAFWWSRLMTFKSVQEIHTNHMSGPAEGLGKNKTSAKNNASRKKATLSPWETDRKVERRVIAEMRRYVLNLVSIGREALPALIEDQLPHWLRLGAPMTQHSLLGLAIADHYPNSSMLECPVFNPHAWHDEAFDNAAEATCEENSEEIPATTPELPRNTTNSVPAVNTVTHDTRKLRQRELRKPVAAIPFGEKKRSHAVRKPRASFEFTPIVPSTAEFVEWENGTGIFKEDEDISDTKMTAALAATANTTATATKTTLKPISSQSSNASKRKAPQNKEKGATSSARLTAAVPATGTNSPSKRILAQSGNASRMRKLPQDKKMVVGSSSNGSIEHTATATADGANAVSKKPPTQASKASKRKAPHEKKETASPPPSSIASGSTISAVSGTAISTASSSTASNARLAKRQRRAQARENTEAGATGPVELRLPKPAPPVSSQSTMFPLDVKDMSADQLSASYARAAETCQHAGKVFDRAIETFNVSTRTPLGEMKQAPVTPSAPTVPQVMATGGKAVRTRIGRKVKLPVRVEKA